MTEPPDIQDAGVWGPPGQPPLCPDPTFDEALMIVLAFGDGYRRCAACQSPAQIITADEFELVPGHGVIVRLNEHCDDCGADAKTRVPVAVWASMEAMRVWEQGRTAKVAMEMELANQADLEELDGPKNPPSLSDRIHAIREATAADIPLALMFCLACKRWIEPRDGKPGCDCLRPRIVEG